MARTYRRDRKGRFSRTGGGKGSARSKALTKSNRKRALTDAQRRQRRARRVHVGAKVALAAVIVGAAVADSRATNRIEQGRRANIRKQAASTQSYLRGVQNSFTQKSTMPKRPVGSARVHGGVKVPTRSNRVFATNRVGTTTVRRRV